MNEIIWKDIKDYEGIYQVSNRGDVKRLPGRFINKLGRYTTVKERILSAVCTSQGYYIVGLSKFASLKNVPIHRLVAEAFIPNPDNLPQVNHIDGDKSHNYVENLEWCTARENNEHAWATKLNKNYPREIKVTDTETGDVTYYHSVQEFSIASGCKSANQCLDNNTTWRNYKIEYTDPNLVEKFLQINSTKQPVGGNTSMPVRCVTTREVFPSVRKCGQHFEFDDETIRRALRYSNGYVKKYNLQFEFVSEV